MPTNLDDSVSGSTELVFPDNGTGTYRLQERSVYDAEEVRNELETDIPQYGTWIPVKDQETGDEAWLTAPSELRSILVQEEIQTGELFRIETMRKSGSEQSDRYLVDVSFPDREQNSPGQQTGLATD
jgi:hypothetical protein